MMHYHGTPITPLPALYELAGRCFCVSFAAPQDVRRCHSIGQSVMLDNGAFSQWKAGKPTDWPAYYAWAEPWLHYPTTWAVVPDHIDAGAEAQDALLAEWPFGDRGSPVWHMDEPIERVVRLCDSWPKVCIGSTSVYAEVLSDPWCKRMDEVFDAIAKRHQRLTPRWRLRGEAQGGRQVKAVAWGVVLAGYFIAVSIEWASGREKTDEQKKTQGGFGFAIMVCFLFACML